MKKLIAFIAALCMILSLATVAYADSELEDTRASYSISNLAAGGTLWSLETVHKTNTYNENMYLVSTDTFSVLGGGSSGHFTARVYEYPSKSTVASYIVARLTGKDQMDGGSLKSNYSNSQIFHCKFVGNDNYGIAATGLYSVGHHS